MVSILRFKAQILLIYTRFCYIYIALSHILFSISNTFINWEYVHNSFIINSLYKF